MKMRSPTDTPIYLALTSGHTLVIGPELVEIPRMFHRMALAEECLPEGVDAPLPAEGEPEATKMDLICKAIRSMLNGNADGDFNNDGRPDVRRLTLKAGFNVSAGERDAAWAIVSEDE